MVDGVRVDSFKLLRHVDPDLLLCRLADLGEPAVAGSVDVLFEDFGHDLQTLLEEHVADSLTA